MDTGQKMQPPRQRTKEGSKPMKLLQMADSIRFRTMTTAELRETFLVTDLFQPGKISLTYVDLDRTIIGSAVPLQTPLLLPMAEALKAAYFTERRELGVFNIGAAGTVVVNGERFALGNLDALYIGRGNESVHFESADPQNPAEFYLLSYPAHQALSTARIESALEPRVSLGTPATANQREITKLIHKARVPSCQLVMGFTQLASGSVWNTMPPHTHMRRSEVYLYFNLSSEDRVLHLMGPSSETRNLVIANKQVVVSPGWSIHSGVGTSNYTFCWGMGGENQDYDDMDRLAVSDLL
jgi:4-deoxy-L-threo-5-hexosulose-uronate ketol-isomerase